MAETDFPDYYALLNIPPDADQATVEAALRREKNRWARRASAAPDGTVRRKADETVEQLDRADEILLDPEARAAYNAARQQPPAGASHTTGKDLAQLLQAARDLLAVRDLRGAAEAAGEAMRENPACAEAHLVLGMVDLGLHLFAQAAGKFQAACDLDPGNAHYRFETGNCYLVLGVPQLAAAQFEAASMLAPYDVLYRAAAAKAMMQADRLDDALAWYDTALRLDAADIRCRNGLAETWLRKGYVPFTPLPSGGAILLSNEAATEAQRCARHGLAVGPTDSRTAQALTQLQGLAAAAHALTWRLPQHRLKWTVRFALLYLLVFAGTAQSGLGFGIAVVGLLLYAWVGLKPGWHYNRRDTAHLYSSVPVPWRPL
ncbi:tetratricopeptide repeat protein [Streptomyces sp. NBC_00648]|uniref:tetratricopeptide repeat protein n=1 Tax=Streptomyces sp. NBC_00648 TaxID=2975797 RepID=UPI00324E39CB